MRTVKLDAHSGFGPAVRAACPLGTTRKAPMMSRCHTAHLAMLTVRRAQKHSATVRASSAGSQSADSSQSSSERPQLVTARKNPQATQFSVLSGAVALVAVGLLLAPSSFLVLRLDGIYSAAEIGVARLIGASLWAQAAALKALASAASNDRLGSDTYKRLNLGLAVWGVIQLVLGTFHASALTNIFWLQTILAVASGLICGQAALKTGVTAPQPVDLASSLVRNKTEFGWIFAFFAVLALALGLGLLAAPFAVFEPSKWRPQVTLVGSYLLRNYASSVLFFSTLFYTLKDSEDRGRSTASTFQLTAQALLLTSLSGVGVFLSGGLRIAAIRDALLAAILAIFLVQRQKQQKPVQA